MRREENVGPVYHNSGIGAKTRFASPRGERGCAHGLSKVVGRPLAPPCVRRTAGVNSRQRKREVRPFCGTASFSRGPALQQIRPHRDSAAASRQKSNAGSGRGNRSRRSDGGCSRFRLSTARRRRPAPRCRDCGGGSTKRVRCGMGTPDPPSQGYGKRYTMISSGQFPGPALPLQ